MSKYGMTTELEWTYDYQRGLDKNNRPTRKVYTAYTVYLPHSCDEWSIAYDRDKTKAVADLEQFIAEAQDALLELNSLPDGMAGKEMVSGSVSNE